MANENLGQCDCPICGHNEANIRESKKFKAYIVCGECGFQGFARGVIANAKLRLKIRQGIELPPDLKVISIKPAAVPVIVAAPAVPAAIKAPVIRRHTADGENVPGAIMDVPAAKELTIFDKDFWKGAKNE